MHFPFDSAAATESYFPACVPLGALFCIQLQNVLENTVHSSNLWCCFLSFYLCFPKAKTTTERFWFEPRWQKAGVSIQSDILISVHVISRGNNPIKCFQLTCIFDFYRFLNKDEKTSVSNMGEVSVFVGLFLGVCEVLLLFLYEKCYINKVWFKWNLGSNKKGTIYINKIYMCFNFCPYTWTNATFTISLTLQFYKTLFPPKIFVIFYFQKLLIL